MTAHEDGAIFTKEKFRFYFIRNLSSLYMDETLSTLFYTSVKKSITTFCIVVWVGNVKIYKAKNIKWAHQHILKMEFNPYLNVDYYFQRFVLHYSWALFKLKKNPDLFHFLIKKKIIICQSPIFWRWNFPISFVCEEKSKWPFNSVMMSSWTVSHYLWICKDIIIFCDKMKVNFSSIQFISWGKISYVKKILFQLVRCFFSHKVDTWAYRPRIKGKTVKECPSIIP